MKKGYVIRYYIEDDMIHESEIFEELKEAISEARCFDCDAFNDVWEEYEKEFGYEPSFLVSVVDVETQTSMYWANTEGDSGSDYDEDM